MTEILLGAIAAAVIILKNKKSVSGVGKCHSVGNVEPAVYVGTYEKYANGSIFGEWVRITDFDNYADFLRYIRELHSDEKDPEFMFQDFEGYPEEWYSESYMDEDLFNKIKKYSELGNKQPFDVYLRYFSDGDFDSFEERYVGEYDSELDFVYQLVDEIGIENIQNKDSYFDYNALARDLFANDYFFVDGYVFSYV